MDDLTGMYVLCIYLCMNCFNFWLKDILSVLPDLYSLTVSVSPFSMNQDSVDKPEERLSFLAYTVRNLLGGILRSECYRSSPLKIFNVKVDNVQLWFEISRLLFDEISVYRNRKISHCTNRKDIIELKHEDTKCDINLDGHVDIMERTVECLIVRISGYRVKSFKVHLL